MKSRRIILIAIIVIAAISALFVCTARVPYETGKRSGWYFAETKASEVNDFRSVKIMVTRARLDQMLFPIPGTARILAPVAVMESSDAIYIVFFESLQGHRFVIYCASKAAHRLLWKALDSNPA